MMILTIRQSLQGHTGKKTSKRASLLIIAGGLSATLVVLLGETEVSQELRVHLSKR